MLRLQRLGQFIHHLACYALVFDVGVAISEAPPLRFTFFAGEWKATRCLDKFLQVIRHEPILPYFRSAPLGMGGDGRLDPKDEVKKSLPQEMRSIASMSALGTRITGGLYLVDYAPSRRNYRTGAPKR